MKDEGGKERHETYRGRSNVEFVSKLGDRLKELEETTYWLELLGDSGTIPQRLELLTNEASQ